ncbi:amino acid adenylation domain-containing protein [Streptomyces xantholiticus]|uniref:Amino acid adenylation domain-containing protein n=1 Tax=Streptomyces xantholiticus TaxID=68285 RepID=A0ABV1V5F6_9ACTN
MLENREGIAVTCSGENVSYGQLDAMSGRASRLLADRGVTAEEPVGLFMERGVNAVAAIVGIVKAGGTYVPLDVRSPTARLLSIVAECGIKRVVVDSAARAAELRARCGDAMDIVVFDEIPDDLPPFKRVASSLQLAYVIYTSGSTGVPKGVEITHRDLVTFALDPCWSNGIDRRILLYSPLNFDASVFEMWVPLLRGGCVVVAPPEDMDAGTLRRLIAVEDVTCAFVTTSLFNVMVEEYPDAFATIRQVWMGGEAASPAVVQRALAACGSGSVVNVYGPTEATIFSTFHVVPDTVGSPVPIGSEMAEVRAYVVDENLESLAAGCEGELCLGGIGVARGYRARPGQTADRFVPDPFASDGSRMYRTGDIVRRRADGLLEFVGRRDNQVKLRGYRIELGEIENQFARRDDTAGVAVVAREDRPGNKTLVAYVVPRRNAVTTFRFAGDGPNGVMVNEQQIRWEQQLLDYARENLPAYMVPSRCVVLDELPLTPNGKLDVRALPAPARAVGGRAPRTHDEELLCRTFADVLGLEGVGIDDNFFELGGHSLLASRVIARIEAASGLRLRAAELFDAPTVAELASRLEALSGVVAPRYVLTARPRPKRVPLSYAQRRLWILNQLEGNTNPAYHIPVLFTLQREPDVDALQAALKDVIERHESLRTVFPDDGETSYQHILDPGQWDVDLAVAQCAPGELDALVTDAIRAPFDLRHQLPIRAQLFRTAERTMLLLVLHHIGADGWSLTPLTRDLSRAYAARVAGADPRLPSLPVQYRDYCAWQHETLGADAGVLDEQLAFWEAWLAGAPDQMRLPADRPRPAMPSHHGDVVTFELPADLCRELEALARSAGTTLFAVLHAGLAGLLTRLGAGEDIVVGSPVAGRSNGALDELVGFFVNTVVLRTDTSGNLSFEDLLGRVREGWVSTYANQDVPFDLLVERLNPVRSLSHHPVFQVALSLLNTSDGDLCVEGLSSHWTLADAKAAKFDLAFTLIPRFAEDGTPGGLEGQVEYATDLFDRTTIQRLADRLVLLLRDAVAHPRRRLGALRVVDDQEAAELLAAHTSLGPVPGTLSEAFREQAAQRPDEVAVLDGSVRLSFRELDARSDALARALVVRGNGFESGVALLLDHGADAVTAMLGVVKAGAAYVPLDSRFPPARMAAMTAECQVRTVLVDTAERVALVQDFASADIEVLLVGDAVQEGHRTDVSIADAVGADQLAYVMYTSGSTGVPKGVAVTHRDVVGLTADARWTPEAVERVVLHSPLAFDASTFEVWVPLLRGGSIVVAPPDEGVAGLYRVIVEADVTTAFMTTALFNVMVHEHPDVFARLRQIWSGGEAASTTAFARAVELSADTVVHVYGPTETTAFATCHTLEKADPHAVPLGTAMQGVRAYILDEHGGLAGTGMSGELCLGGVGVARGYLRRPGLTAERFVPDPYGPAGSRMYRTGDLFRRRSDGLLEFEGRLDRQVKIRGFRIEPGEIETLLTQVPEVAQATVLVREDQSIGRTLVAYVVPVSGTPEEDELAGRLRDHLRKHLPAYMVPSAVVPVGALPLTPQGKIDVRALPAPLIRTASRPPRSPGERVLCALFAETLGLDTVGIDDSFFERGGHSLLAIRLVSRLRADHGVDIPVRELFRVPTVAELVAGLDEAAARRLTTSSTGLATIARTTSPDKPAPLSLAQQRLWFLDQLRPFRPDYNVPVARRLTGPLDTARLRRALTALVEHHDILRTRYEAPDGEPYQTVDPVAEPPLHLVDHSTAPAEQDFALVEGTIAHEAARPFDLEAAPPVRFVLVKLADQDHVLVMVIHHIATDGWSNEVLWRDLATLYTGGPQTRLPELPIRYADYAQWQQGQQDGPRFKVELEYWRQRLTDLEPIELPGDRPRPAQQSGRGAQLDFAIPAELRQRVLDLGRRHGTTPFMTLLTAFQVLVGQLTGRQDIAIGIPVASRGRPELEPLAGFFVNAVVLRSTVDPWCSFTELLARTRAHAAEAYSHSEVPFDRLVTALKPQRDLSRNPLFQLSFALSDTDITGLSDSWGELSVSPHPVRFTAAKFDLEIAVAGRGDHFAGTTYYATDLFDEATVQRFLRQYRDLLEAVVERPDAAVATLAPKPM